jgi:hypothetical protein
MTTALPPESLLVGHIRAHIKQGEKAKERADQARGKAEQHFIAAGRHLMTLKAHYAADWAAWELLLKTKVDISTGRASERRWAKGFTAGPRRHGRAGQGAQSRPWFFVTKPM